MKSKRVVGIGGVFLKCNNPAVLLDWYEQHLGFKRAQGETATSFSWRRDDGSDTSEKTHVAFFPADTRYFEPSKSPVMLNYIVDDLDRVLSELAAEGVEIDPRREDYDFGRFAWIMDPEGNRIELWQPLQRG